MHAYIDEGNQWRSTFQPVLLGGIFLILSHLTEMWYLAAPPRIRLAFFLWLTFYPLLILSYRLTLPLKPNRMPFRLISTNCFR
mmetsp:Transcript_17080/g.28374  ORF Transcript_17080/g.28374 Transcript_17080/m.28374 type:complete len:83 (+) Transcript_17080:157-405(+)